MKHWSIDMLTTTKQPKFNTGGVFVTLFGCVGLAGILLASSISAEAKTISGFTVANCYEDYEDVNFCSTKFVKAYQKAVKKGANFHKKYALTLIDTGSGLSEVVAIDLTNRRVTTLGVAIKPIGGKVKYSKDSDTLCFMGDISGYRQDNSYKKVCYTLQKDPYSDVNPHASGMQFMQSLTKF